MRLAVSRIALVSLCMILHGIMLHLQQACDVAENGPPTFELAKDKPSGAQHYNWLSRASFVFLDPQQLPVPYAAEQLQLPYPLQNGVTKS